jgi:mono/diheme cytochrome c family protein
MKTVILPAIICSIVLFSFVTPQQVGIKASLQRGQKVYEATCLACHQADAGGVPNMNPPLIKTKWVLGDKKALAKIVLHGLKGGEISIDGDTFNNPMPAQETVMTDQQIADVLTYVRNSFGNKASAVTVADVAATRAKLNQPAGKTTAPVKKAAVPVKKPAPKKQA